MTDKELIINAVDVSECEFLWKEKLPKKVCNNGNLDCDCNSNLNCIFKQLKHKEQEYEELRRYHNKCCEENTEELKQWLEKYNQVSINFYNGDYCNTEHCSLLKAKEQECKELKKEKAEIKKYLGISHKTIIQRLEELQEFKDKLKISEDKYKQALDEIGKLIPKFYSSMGWDYGDFDCENCSDLDGDTVCTYKLKKVIEDVI